MLYRQLGQSLRRTPVRFIMGKGFENPFFHDMKTFGCRQLNQVVGALALSPFLTAVGEGVTPLLTGPALTGLMRGNVIVLAHRTFMYQGSSQKTENKAR